MKKLVAVGLAALVALSLAAPVTAQPSVRRDELAFADWMIPTAQKNEFKWYAAYAARSTKVPSGSGWFNFAGFVKGDCIRKKKPNSVMTSCESTDYIAGDVERDFKMDALAESAVLKVRKGGHTHVARWSATEPGLYSASEYCFTIEEGEEEEEGQGHGGGIWRDADPTTRFFGRSFTSKAKGPSFGVLLTGVMVTTCSFRSIEYDEATNTLRVTSRVPR